MVGNKNKGKSINWKQNPSGWRGQESGDPLRRHGTASARRGEGEATGHGVGARPERLLAASTKAYHHTQAQYSDQCASEDDTDSFSSEGCTDELDRSLDQSDCREKSIAEKSPGFVPARNGTGRFASSKLPPTVEGIGQGAIVAGFVPPRSATGRFAPSRQGRQGRGAGPSIGDAGPSNSRQAKRSRTDDSDWRITGEMPGGPCSTLVIPSYGGHIARVIWEGGERSPHEVIECVTRKTVLRDLQRIRNQMDPCAATAIGRVALAGVADLMFDHIDFALVAAFVERWQPDTNTFHLPFGEMTIMLHDVQQILGLDVDGMMPPCPNWDTLDGYVNWIFLSYDIHARRTYDNGGILDRDLRDICTSSRYPIPHRVKAWLLSLLGNSLLVDQSKDRVHPHPWMSTDDVDQVAWGTVTLAYLYRQLGVASRAGATKVGGCLTLLQAWIYEYFPTFRPHPERYGVPGPRASRWVPRQEARSLERLRMIRTTLDELSKEHVVWCPYGPSPSIACRRTLYMGCIRAFDVTELYMPDRVVRQLGHRQHIPPVHPRPSNASRPAKGEYKVEFHEASVDSQWSMFPMGNQLNLNVLPRCTTVPWETVRDYSTWYCRVSHPYLTNDETATQSTVDDPTSLKYWAYEWPKYVQPLLSMYRGIGPTVHVPVKVYDDLMDMYRRWCECMNIPVTQSLGDDDDQ